MTLKKPKHSSPPPFSCARELVDSLGRIRSEKSLDLEKEKAKYFNH